MELDFHRDFVKLEDGGQLSIDWLNWPDSTKQEKDFKIILVWTGCGGCSDRAYVKFMIDYLVKGNSGN